MPSPKSRLRVSEQVAKDTCAGKHSIGGSLPGCLHADDAIDGLLFNLDNSPASDLRAFLARSILETVKALDRAGKGEGKADRVAAVLALRDYARNTLTARDHRELGKINSAVQIETYMDRVYRKLPDWAKW